ncbi:MAG: ABC transporter substrate-binding protein [Candidatus Velthaea sp.]
MTRVIRLAGAVLACTLAVSAGAPSPARSAETYTVRVGVLSIIVDAPFHIADKKGYFKEEGIDVKFVTFASSGNMVVPLTTDQLDVGGGAPTAGIYNGFVKGLNVKVVADKGTDAKGYGFNPLMVRKELVTSGKFKTPKDLRGMTIAVNQPGSVSASSLFELLKKYGLTLAQVRRENLDYPEHVAAFSNGKVDAGITAEPSAADAERRGVAVRIMGNDAWYPNQQLSVVIYSNDFITKHRDVAQRFMRAYLKGARFYYGALKDGHFAGPNANEVIAILTATTNIKDPQTYREIRPSALNPDGRVNLVSMRKDLTYFRDQGIVEGTVRVEDIVDESFVKQAAKELGPYRPPGRSR